MTQLHESNHKEKVYRFFVNNRDKYGKKIPYIPKRNIYHISKNEIFDKTESVSFFMYMDVNDPNKHHGVLVNINRDGHITCYITDLLKIQEDVMKFCIDKLNFVIDKLHQHIDHAKIIYKNVDSLDESSIEILDLHYKSNITNIDLTRLSSITRRYFQEYFILKINTMILLSLYISVYLIMIK